MRCTFELLLDCTHCSSSLPYEEWQVAAGCFRWIRTRATMSAQVVVSGCSSWFLVPPSSGFSSCAHILSAVPREDSPRTFLQPPPSLNNSPTSRSSSALRARLACPFVASTLTPFLPRFALPPFVTGILFLRHGSSLAPPRRREPQLDDPHQDAALGAFPKRSTRALA